MRTERNKDGSYPVELPDGRVQWWRPDLAYKSFRKDNWPRSTALFGVAICLIGGPAINSFQKDAEELRQRKEAKRRQRRERIKQEEKWRIEARREYED